MTASLVQDEVVAESYAEKIVSLQKRPIGNDVEEMIDPEEAEIGNEANPETGLIVGVILEGILTFPVIAEIVEVNPVVGGEADVMIDVKI
jgi:hypothetical protein